MFYSQKNRGFYSADIHGDAIPPDAVEISEADYKSLISSQLVGDVIVAGAGGFPVAVKASSLIGIDEVKAAKLASLRNSRDAASVANVTVQGKVFTAEPNTQTGIKRLADRMRRGKTTTLTAVLDVDGVPVSLSQALLDGIEDAIAANAEAAWNKYVQLAGQVKAATTAEQVNAVVW